MKVVTYYILALIGHVNKLNWQIPNKVFGTIWENCLFLPTEGNKDIFFSYGHLFPLSGNFHVKITHTLSILANSLGRTHQRPGRVHKKSQEKVAFSIVGQESYKSNLWSPVLGVTLSGPRIIHISQISLHCNQSHLHPVTYNQKNFGEHTIQRS